MKIQTQASKTTRRNFVSKHAQTCGAGFHSNSKKNDRKTTKLKLSKEAYETL